MATYTDHSTHYNLRSYITGFVLSVTLTLVSYAVVVTHTTHAGQLFNHPAIIAIISVLAFVQFCVQLFYFLHLGDERRPRWKLLILMFMVIIMLILVGGSIWVMYNLNDRMMPSPSQINQYMQEQTGL